VKPIRLLLIWAVLAGLAVFSGCAGEAPADMPWAAPPAAAGGAAHDGIQETLDAYGNALVSKDRAAFLAQIDPASTAFLEQQILMFDRLGDVPFSKYEIVATSISDPAPGTAIAKVEFAWNYAGSFTGRPNPERSAFLLVKKAEGWRLAGDATAQALGKPRDAHLEDFGTVRMLNGDRVLVLYHSESEAVAQRAATLTQNAFPRLETSLPGVTLPKVPIVVYDSHDQVEQAFPGRWATWTGGASLMLGSETDQGGEIIIDAAAFNNVDGYAPEYNPKMLAHELTHVALFSLTTTRTPPFLEEGLADYVGQDIKSVLLPQKLRNGASFRPTLSDLYRPGGFNALLDEQAATLAYEQADTAVDFLEKRYGQDAVPQLIREFKRRDDEEKDQDRLVDGVFRTVLGVGWDEFEAQWRQYVISGS